MSEKIAFAPVRMSVTETPPSITKVEMKDQGKDGLRVRYTTMEVRNNVVSNVSYNKTQSRPVQSDLRDLFNLLKDHLLLTTGYSAETSATWELMKSNTEVRFAIMDDQD